MQLRGACTRGVSLRLKACVKQRVSKRAAFCTLTWRLASYLTKSPDPYVLPYHTAVVLLEKLTCVSEHVVVDSC
jgi:hypothetical protein